MISREEVEKIAHLARLELSSDKVGELQEHFNKVIGHFNEINQIDTLNVKPMVTPHDILIPLRADVVEKTLSVDEIMQNAPDIKDNLFKVPPVV
jgi:aspartyl-tRNA(Asn)/glutamyl-tRNA(Gln) amidotransferase subunit C